MRTLAIFVLLSSTALAQTSPVPPNTLDWGNGRIDASTVYRYIGQTVVACGRAVQNDYQSPNVVMGVSPDETIVIFPPNTSPNVGARISGRLICATGEAVQPPEIGGYGGLGVRAAIDAVRVEVTSMPQPRYQGPCIMPNGQISGRATYGGAPVRQPFPPCE